MPSAKRTGRAPGAADHPDGLAGRYPEATYLAAASVLNDIGAAYIHIAEADWDDAR